jgi:hypothetical protein
LNPKVGVRTLAAMASAESKGPGFTVTDRRSFTDDKPSQSPERPAEEPASSASDDSALAAVDFHTFVLSFGSSALLHLGELEHPDGEKRQDLPLAKQTIDILAMLEAKTKGNLTGPEEKLIQSLLYDLRLRYVELTTGK